MDFLAAVAERRIREAIERGELDDLPNRGEPIRREDLSDVPEELRMGYKVLKNAGVLPEELQINREMLRLRDLLTACEDPQEQREIKKRLSLKSLHFNELMEKNRRNASFNRYADRITGKLGL